MALRERLPGNSHYICSVLEQLGFQKIKRRHGGWNASCRFHDDKQRHFSISDDGLWMCWTGSCEAKGNLKQLHERLGAANYDWREGLKMLGAQLESRTKEYKPRKTKKIVGMPEGFSNYAMEGEVPRQIARRLEFETIDKFGLGYTTGGERTTGRCIIPITYKRRTVGWHGRALTDRVFPRYYNAEGFDIKDYLFNYDGVEKGKELLVVEGAFNAMSMTEKGFPNVVATFGTEFKAKQVGRLFELQPSSVVLCFDRDKSKKMENGKEGGLAGQKATLKLANLIGDLLPVWVMPLPIGKDPNDLPVEKLRACYEMRRRFDDVVRNSSGRGRDTRPTP